MLHMLDMLQKCRKSSSLFNFVLKNSPWSFQNTVKMTTGLFDFPKMVVFVLKTAFTNLISKKVKKELNGKINKNSNLIGEYDFFDNTFLPILNRYASIKTKILRASHVLYVTDTLRNAIMKRTELETKYLKNKMGISLKAYKKQRRFCSTLSKKERERY